MGRLIVSEFVTLDGIVEAPGLEEHQSGRNGWALRHTDAEMEQINWERTMTADALLLGRATYQIWASYWPSAAESDPHAKRLNEIPKYVVSTTLKEATWKNTTLLGGDVGSEVANLKARIGGDILCYGSTQLVVALMAEDLVDEYRLMLFPVVLGSGKHLFKNDIPMQHMRLMGTQVFGTGTVLLTYVPEEHAPTSEYLETYSWTPEQVRSLHAAQDTDRVLATVLFTDIVKSTEQASALGDRAWKELLERHDAVVRQELARFRGREIDTAGDGLLATFDAPVRAVRCAEAIVQAVRAIGVEVRAGVHTGEVELSEKKVRGIAVHIGARVAALAAPNQVLVSAMVRDLLGGSGIEFDDVGVFELKGVPGEWRLFAVRL